MFELFIASAIAYALVATRMAAFVVTSPFPGPAAPAQVKIGLVLLLALAAAPVVGASSVPPFDLRLVPAALAEITVGAAIGFVFRVGTSAADVLGASIAHAMGLSLASSYDPALGTTSDPMARLVTTAAMLAALAVGAHRIVIGAVVASLQAFPIGTAPDLGAVAPALLDWVARAVDCGVGLALPAITVSMAVQLALAMVARAAPSLQVFSVGLSLTLVSGLLVVLTGSGAMLAGIAALLEEAGLVLATALAR
jgi:flagellar biosynthetic protein FliR